ncbi:unnamed protein product, partial [Brachionus calyciflorus]
MSLSNDYLEIEFFTECPTCEEIFDSKVFGEHFLSCYSTLKLTCSFCNEQFRNSEFLKHIDQCSKITKNLIHNYRIKLKSAERNLSDLKKEINERESSFDKLNSFKNQLKCKYDEIKNQTIVCYRCDETIPIHEYKAHRRICESCSLCASELITQYALGCGHLYCFNCKIVRYRDCRDLNQEAIECVI